MKLSTLTAAILLFIGNIFSQGAIDLTFNNGDPGFGKGDGFNSTVRTSSAQSDGKIIFGGAFTSYSGNAVNRIVRVDINGNFDATFTTNSGFDGLVTATFVQSDGKIIVGGDFTSFNGVPRNKIARLNTDGTLDLTFDPAAGFDSTVLSISVQPDDAKILLGGAFTQFNGSPVNHIIRLNVDGTQDMTFVTGSGFNNPVNAIGIQSDGKIIVGGAFTNYDGSSLNYVARLTVNGPLDGTFNTGTGPGNTINCLLVESDDKIVLGGAFTTFNGTTRKYNCKLNADGTLDTSYTPITNINGIIRNLAKQSTGKYVFVGEFTTPFRRVIRLNSDGTQDNTLTSVGNGSLSSIYTVVIQSTGKIVIGGSFSDFNIIGQGRACRLAVNGSVDLTFNTVGGANSVVSASVIQNDGKLVIGGSFSIYNGISRRAFCRLNTDGTLDGSFVPNYGGTAVTAMAIQSDGKILIGGNYVQQIIRVNTDGSNDATFTYTGPSIGVFINAISVQTDGKILVAGSFTSFDGSSANRIVRLNSDGTIDNSFNIGTGFNNITNTIVIQPDGKIIVGGTFTSYNGVSANRIIRLNTDGSADNSFVYGSGFDASVSTLCVLTNGKIAVGGSFLNYNGTAATRIIQLNEDGSNDVTFNTQSGFDNVVSSIAAQNDNKLIVAGAFTNYNGTLANHIARLQVNGAKDTFFNSGNGFNGNVSNLLVQPDWKIVAAGSFTGYDGTGRNRVIRINNNDCSAFSGNSTHTDNSCYGDSSATASISPSGGNSPYTYEWENGDNASVRNNLPAGDYSAIVSDINGCSYFGTITITQPNQIQGQDVISSCSAITWIDGNTYSTDNNTATHILSASNGCDSLVFLHLTILSNSATQTIAHCGDFTWPLNNTTYSSTGVYIDTLTNENGCDSIVTLNLTIHPIPVAVATDNGSATIMASGSGSYQWMNCSTNTIIDGETGTNFTPASNGSYSVIVSNGNCSDTSSCVEINYLNIPEKEVFALNIYPNPTTDKLTISTEIYPMNLKISDAAGKILLEKTFTSEAQFSMIGMQSGIYFFEIFCDRGSVIRRVVKN